MADLECRAGSVPVLLQAAARDRGLHQGQQRPLLGLGTGLDTRRGRSQPRHGPERQLGLAGSAFARVAHLERLGSAVGVTSLFYCCRCCCVMREDGYVWLQSIVY